MMNYAVEKLLKRWNLIGHIVIGVRENDLKPSNDPGPTPTEVRELLIDAERNGAKLVMYTYKSSDEFSAITEWAALMHLNFQSINNFAGFIELDVLLDRRAGFGEAFNVLEEALDLYKAKIFTH